MLFRPSFCANCGERIERADWKPWTSRRFCEICELEFKGQEWIPRIIVFGGLLLAVFGCGSYLQGSRSSDSPVVKQPRKLVEQPVQTAQTPNIAPVGNTGSTTPETPGKLEQRNQTSASGITGAEKTPAKVQKTVDSGPIYYCGAATKKGTPCSRRVKGNTRCFQHAGMPAMLPPDKLRIN